jgi:hypothetical protein
MLTIPDRKVLMDAINIADGPVVNHIPEWKMMMT